MEVGGEVVVADDFAVKFIVFENNLGELGIGSGFGWIWGFLGIEENCGGTEEEDGGGMYIGGLGCFALLRKLASLIFLNASSLPNRKINS